jgi:hypothetical protein
MSMQGQAAAPSIPRQRRPRQAIKSTTNLSNLTNPPIPQSQNPFALTPVASSPSSFTPSNNPVATGTNKPIFNPFGPRVNRTPVATPTAFGQPVQSVGHRSNITIPTVGPSVLAPANAQTQLPLQPFPPAVTLANPFTTIGFMKPPIQPADQAIAVSPVPIPTGILHPTAVQRPVSIPPPLSSQQVASATLPISQPLTQVATPPLVDTKIPPSPQVSQEQAPPSPVKSPPVSHSPIKSKTTPHLLPLTPSLSFTDPQSDSPSIETTPPARPFDINKQLTDEDTSFSTSSSVMPASTHAHARRLPAGESQVFSMSEDDSNGSSDTEDAQAAPNPKQVRLASQAQEHDRISTLRSFVQQWREYSTKSRENRQELNARNERAEKIANDITLGARFSNHGGDFLSASTKKRITIEADATQMFIMAEEVSSWLSTRVIVQSEGSLRKLVTNKGYGPQRHLPVFCLN